MLDLVNKERAKKGLVALKASAMLERSAQAHANDMLKKKYFSHTSLDGKNAEARIRAAGYLVLPCTACTVQFYVGENIAKGQKTVDNTMRAWMASKVHRENILKPEFREMGMGYAGGIWVQNFGGIIVSR